jgi:hypothetical protein
MERRDPEEPNPGLERTRHQLRASGAKEQTHDPLRSGIHTRVVWPMPNHLLGDILKSWKQFTSRRAKRLLGLGKEPFWQPESYDHWIRNDEEKARISRYVANNPVTAGLCVRPEDWRWSSAWHAPS